MSAETNGVAEAAPAGDPLYDPAIIPDLLAKIGAMTVRQEMQHGQLMHMAAQRHAALTELERHDRAMDGLAGLLDQGPEQLRELWQQALAAAGE